MAILICMYVRYNCREVWQKICSNRAERGEQNAF